MSEQGLSRKRIWTGRILTALPVLVLMVDSTFKFIQPPEVTEGTMALGYQVDVLVYLGITLLTSTLLFLYPRTAFIGGILLAGYLGGAIATHVRIGNPWPTHILFPVYFGIMLWAGLALRRPEVEDALLGRDDQTLSKKRLWAGRIMSAIPVMFLLFAAGGKFVQPVDLIKFHADLGWDQSLLTGLGILIIACTVTYLYPRTAVIGAILLTAYLGGAVASHVRVGVPLSGALFPAYFGVLLWAGLVARRRRLPGVVLGPRWQ